MLIREALGYNKHGMKYLIDSRMDVPYIGGDGMTLNRRVPLLGNLILTRSHFVDVVEGGEIIVDPPQQNPVAAFVRR